MSERDSFFDRLADRFEDANLEVERVGDTFNLSRGRGGGGARANVDPSEFVDTWLDRPEPERERAAAAYVSGIRHVLLEPSEGDGAEMEFPEAAGRLLMRIEPEPFRAGAEAAAGESPWTQPFHDDLIIAFLIELDMGMRVLDEAQFEAWSATPDRVHSAARSMLYHKARNTQPSALENYPEIEQLRVGDGCDAARILTVDDLFFGEFDGDSRLAIPDSETLLFSRTGDDEGVEALREAAAARYETGEVPLTTDLFRFEKGKPVAVE